MHLSHYLLFLKPVSKAVAGCGYTAHWFHYVFRYMFTHLLTQLFFKVQAVCDIWASYGVTGSPSCAGFGRLRSVGFMGLSDIHGQDLRQKTNFISRLSKCGQKPSIYRKRLLIYKKTWKTCHFTGFWGCFPRCWIISIFLCDLLLYFKILIKTVKLQKKTKTSPEN